MPTTSFPGPQSQGQTSAQASQSGQQPGGQDSRENSTPGEDGQSDSSGDASSQGGDQEPGQSAGAQSRGAGQQGGDGANGRDSSTGDLNNGQSGQSGSNGGTLGTPGGDYSLDTLPTDVLGGNGQANSTGSNGGAMTSAERAAILDERLRRGYETFDGFILGERERAQNESNAAGSVSIGGEAGGGGGGQNQPQTIEQTSSSTPSGAVAAVGQPQPGGQEAPETFPPPEDIPSGRDDDVVARQIRELAMQEPDPELREALWEEYRKYTGIGED